MKRVKQRSQGYDFALLIPTMLLLTLGLIVIYSSSSVLAQKEMGDSYYFLKRQGAYALVGIFLMMIAKNMPLGFYKKMVYPFLFFNLLMLVIVLVPGIGVKIGGARRWLRFFGISFQPSELAKLCLSMYMAYS